MSTNAWILKYVHKDKTRTEEPVSNPGC